MIVAALSPSSNQGVPGPLPSPVPGTVPSSPRVRIPSLAKTLLRWYSTVRKLTNSRVAISGLDSPDRASSAICRSWGVRSKAGVVDPPLRQLAGGEDRPAGPVGEAVGAHGLEGRLRRREVAARVTPTSLPPQPSAVEQLGPGELEAQACRSETAERLGGSAPGQPRSPRGCMLARGDGRVDPPKCLSCKGNSGCSTSRGS